MRAKGFNIKYQVFCEFLPLLKCLLLFSEIIEIHFPNPSIRCGAEPLIFRAEARVFWKALQIFVFPLQKFLSIHLSAIVLISEWIRQFFSFHLWKAKLIRQEDG